MGRAQRADSSFHSRVSNLARFIAAVLIPSRSPGTAFAVRGQSNVIPAFTDSTLRCTVDGVETESEVVTSRNLVSWRLCVGEGLSNGLHHVVVNITAGANIIFWVDEMLYYSLSPPNLKQKSSMLLPSTTAFRYTSISWMNPFDRAGNFGRESYQHGAKAIIPFYGMISY